MINKVGQIMVYVNNLDSAAAFWSEKVGFTVISDEEGHGMRWIEIAPSKDAETSIVLHNKELVAKMEPELNLVTPSLMFYTDNLNQLLNDFRSKNITVGEVVTLSTGRVFNFADDEENYFAVMEKSK